MARRPSEEKGENETAKGLSSFTCTPVSVPPKLAGFTMGVVVPVRNGAKTITQCLEAIVLAGLRSEVPVGIIVVDNGSTDQTRETIRAGFGGEVTLIEDPDAAVGRLRNLGAARLRSDVLVFVDADCVICPNYFNIAADALKRTGADAVGSPYSLPANPGWIEATWDALHLPAEAGPVGWLMAGNLVIRRAAFMAVNGFDDFLASGEDPDLGARLEAGGFAQYVDFDLVSVHLGNPKDLPGFFRQQWWHGLGMLGGATARWRDRPLLMTMMHGVLTVGAVVMLVTNQPSATVWAAVLASQACAPVASVLFRMGRAGRWSNPVPGVVLYWLYFWARLVALATTTLGVPKAPRGRQ